MFVRAIEVAAAFTRPIHLLTRAYGSAEPEPGAGTLILVNEDGWALTCRHVVDAIAANENAQKNYTAFKEELARVAGKKVRQARRELERKYQLSDSSLAQGLTQFVSCVDSLTGFEALGHPTYDVALIHFEGFNRVLATDFPVFAAAGSDLKQGKTLCRLGYPFVEFTNFEYDAEADALRWTQTGQMGTPRFPLEGMVTRHLGSNQGIHGFEVSTPGLRGQSGGPAFDVEGRVWGMQAATRHLDLNFDVDMHVRRGGRRKRVQESAFLHVGHCVHVDVLKEFMRSHGVSFKEG